MRSGRRFAHSSAATLRDRSNFWGEKRSLPLWLSANGPVAKRRVMNSNLAFREHPSVQGSSSRGKTNVGSRKNPIVPWPTHRSTLQTFLPADRARHPEVD